LRLQFLGDNSSSVHIHWGSQHTAHRSAVDPAATFSSAPGSRENFDSLPFAPQKMTRAAAATNLGPLGVGDNLRKPPSVGIHKTTHFYEQFVEQFVDDG